MTSPLLPGPALAPPVFAPVSLSVTPEQKLELLEYWRSITKRKWLILALGLATALLAGVVALALTPVYRSTALVLIEASKGKILSIEDIYTVNPQREHYQTQVEVLKSREVAERTVRALKLWEHQSFDPRKAPPSIRSRLLGLIGIGQPETEWTEERLVASAVKQLQARLSVEPVRLSQLVKVSFESEDPKLAAQVANALAAEYIDADRDARFQITQSVSSFLQDRLTSLREKLTQSEQALQKYRENKGIVSLSGSAQTMAGQQVGGTSDKLLAARARRLELESSYQQLKAIGNGDYSGVPAIMRDPSVVESLRLYNDAKRRLSDALQRLGSQHPSVRQIEGELAQLSATLNQQRNAAATSLRREYEAALGTELSLQKALGAARGEVQNVNREEFQLTVLEREVATNRQLYDMFMSRAKETNLASDVQASVGRVVDGAVPSSVPFKPDRLQIVAVATVLALFVGALASVLMDRLDNTVKGGEDAEIRLRQPLLTALPEVPGLDRTKMARRFLEDGHSHFSEAIRTARTGVLLSNLDAAHKTLLITSSLPGEGKTTVAVNLALAHAQTRKTLLIDCDMRRSQVTHSLGMPKGAKGLTNLVAGSSPAADCIYPVADSPLMVMPVGDLPPNPLELLLSQRFKEVLRQLGEEFEMVIIDSPPVELVSDALVIGPLVTSTAFIVKAMSTPAPLVRKSLARLQRSGTSILGVVVNQLDFRHAQLYYGEYGASSYAYGSYGYGGKLTYGAAATAEAGKAAG